MERCPGLARRYWFPSSALGPVSAKLCFASETKTARAKGKSFEAELPGGRSQAELGNESKVRELFGREHCSVFSPPLTHGLLLLLAVVLLLSGSRDALAIEQVEFTRDGRTLRVEGRVRVEATDGGLLLESADGTLWTLQPDEIRQRTRDSRLPRPLTKEAIEAHLLEQLPVGFKVHRTKHYLVCYNTSYDYAKWCGSLLERLYRAFTNYWIRQGFELYESSGPLVVMVFADASSYRAYGKDDLGSAANQIIGYYSLRTNRVSMYDLTGSESSRGSKNQRGSAAEINRLLSRSAAIPLVATIVHEATHQIAFNCGLHARYADVPLWLSEGLAVYFETPDLKSKKGWRGIGAVNRPRLATFRANLATRPAGSIEILLADDRRLRDPQTAAVAYAEAWALNYFLIRHRPKEYTAYLKMVSEKEPLIWNTPEERIEEFKQIFGNDLDQLESEFLRYMRKVQ